MQFHTCQVGIGRRTNAKTLGTPHSAIHLTAFTTNHPSKIEYGSYLTSTPKCWLTRMENICHYGLVYHFHEMKQLTHTFRLNGLGSCSPQRSHNAFGTRHRIRVSLCNTNFTRWSSTNSTSRPKTALFFPGIEYSHSLPTPITNHSLLRPGCTAHWHGHPMGLCLPSYLHSISGRNGPHPLHAALQNHSRRAQLDPYGHPKRSTRHHGYFNNDTTCP